MMGKDESGIRLTDVVVGGTMGVVLLITAFAILGVKYGALATLFLIYEGYTLVNRHPEDTLSESVWRLASRPIVPLLFGVAAGWALGSGFVGAPAAWFAFGILYGHFFFQRQQGSVESAVVAQAAVEAAVETAAVAAEAKKP